MPTIADANANTIRPGMQVFCGITYAGNAELSFEVEDALIYDNLENEEPANLTDLAYDGFPLDGSCVEYTPGMEGIGAFSYGGFVMSIFVTSTAVIPGVTIRCSGEGEVHVDGEVYPLRDGMVVPVDRRWAMLDFYSVEGRRIIVWNISAGVNISWTNKDIVSVVVALRSDLSVVSQDLQTSDIEIQAYWPDDITDVVTAIGDDAPLWYYAGYPGDYSPMRTFYVCEEINQEDNIITIKGEDAMGRLDYETDAMLLSAVRNGPARSLYSIIMDLIKDAGIPVSCQSRPVAQPGSGRIIIPEATAGEIVANIMHLAHSGSFWPVYVDAGIPRLTWSVPTRKWDIYEEDCGSVSIDQTRNVRKILPSDKAVGIRQTVSDNNAGALDLIGGLETVEKGHPITLGFDGYWENVQVYGDAKLVSYTLTEAVCESGQTKASKAVKQWLAVKKNKEKLGDSQAAVFGREITITRETPNQRKGRIGTTETIEVLPLGTEYFDEEKTQLAYPRYARIFELSNESGKFTWKGNPKMQPRDVFRFHRLDGSYYNCTIQEIILTHEGGGLTAEITYRKGVV